MPLKYYIKNNQKQNDVRAKSFYSKKLIIIIKIKFQYLEKISKMLKKIS